MQHLAGFRGGEITLGDGENFIDALIPAGRGLLAHPSLRAPRDVLFLHRSLGGRSLALW